jgi:opacity protein-like surface antigen
MKKILAVLPLMAGVAVTPAHAQLAGATGRVELRVGLDEVRPRITVFDEAETEDFEADDYFYGLEAGVDGHFGNATIGGYVGAEKSEAKACEIDVIDTGDEGCIDADTNYYAGIRGGVQTGDLGLIYIKGGYSRGKFRGSYTDDFGDEIFSDKGSADGWHVGAGFELSVGRNAYLKGEYVHSWYNDVFNDLEDPDEVQIRRHQLLAGVGIRFGGSAPAPVVELPPPPPPLAPATQTCPDGSVILATDVCPAAPLPPPPPPPPPSGERG